jgi:hypothetical protein
MSFGLTIAFFDGFKIGNKKSICFTLIPGAPKECLWQNQIPARCSCGDFLDFTPWGWGKKGQKIVMRSRQS